MTAAVAERTGDRLLALARAQGLVQLPVTIDEPPGDGWILEPKFDGWRVTIFRVEDGVHIVGRRGTEVTRQLAPQVEELEELPVGTVLDAEAVCLRVVDGEVVDDWGSAQSALSTGSPTRAQMESVTLMVFDVLAFDEIDCRALPFVERRTFLEQLHERYEFERIQIPPQAEATRENYEGHVAAGFEGSMAKRLNAPYATGKRGAGWARLKHTHTEDYVVVGYEEGEDSCKGMLGALVVGQYVDGTLTEQCKVGTGFKVAERQKLWARREDLIGRVCEVKTYAGVAQRHPVFLRWRGDKRAEDCTPAT